LAWAGATALALALVLFLHHRAVEAQRAESAARLSALAKGWLQGSTNWPDTQRLLQMSQALDPGCDSHSAAVGAEFPAEPAAPPGSLNHSQALEVGVAEEHVATKAHREVALAVNWGVGRKA
jgi:hypothetical protein